MALDSSCNWKIEYSSTHYILEQCKCHSSFGSFSLEQGIDQKFTWVTKQQADISAVFLVCERNENAKLSVRISESFSQWAAQKQVLEDMNLWAAILLFWLSIHPAEMLLATMDILLISSRWYSQSCSPPLSPLFSVQLFSLCPLSFTADLAFVPKISFLSSPKRFPCCLSLSVAPSSRLGAPDFVTNPPWQLDSPSTCEVCLYQHCPVQLQKLS